MFIKRCTHLMKMQKGQSMVMGLAFLMFSSLLTIVLFNTGQLSSEKMRLANTADAAAYSGLVWQARALNFQAYTNRAMIANQVSIAQVVSLTSWMSYADTFAQNVNNTLGWIPPVRPFTQAVANAVGQFDTVLERVARVAIPIMDTIVGVLSTSQVAVYNATFLATPEVVREVVRRNDPRYTTLNTVYTIASVASNASQWANLARRYDTDEGYTRQADVIMRSRDNFSRSRYWHRGRFNVGVMRVDIFKEGETRLQRDASGNSSGGDTWHWKGKDNLSVHVQTFGCRRGSCGWRHRELPIAAGSTYVDEDVRQCGENGSSGGCPRWMRHNRRGESYSDSLAEDLNARYSGLRAYYDMRDLSDQNRDPRLVLSVEVQVAGDSMRTSSHVDGIGSAAQPSDNSRNGIETGMFRADDRLARASMASIGTGEIFFKRPSTAGALLVGNSERTEYANLFNPYWEVRLRETSNTQRLSAWAVRSPGLLGSSGGRIPGS